MAEEKKAEQDKEKDKARNDENKDQGISNTKMEKTEKEGEKHEKIEKEKNQETKQERKKEEALVYGRNAQISTKHAMAICRAVKNKTISNALDLLEKVIKKKKAIAFKGEIPHRKGMMSGRYPLNASGYFIKLIKSLRANADNVGIDTGTARIYFANANKASMTHRRKGTKFKRTHVLLKLKDIKNNKEEKSKK